VPGRTPLADDEYLPSFSAGAGVAAEDAASVGMEWELMPDQFWSFGLGWAKPSKKTHGAGPRDEYVVADSRPAVRKGPCKKSEKKQCQGVGAARNLDAIEACRAPAAAARL
jgi:hypothetical protein